MNDRNHQQPASDPGSESGSESKRDSKRRDYPRGAAQRGGAQRGSSYGRSSERSSGGYARGNDRQSRRSHEGHEHRGGGDNHRARVRRPSERSGGDRNGANVRRYEASDRHHREQYSTDRSVAPPIDESVEARDLAPAIRSRLRTLSKENSEKVARHLVMASKLLEEDPRTAYEHAKAAVRSAGRVDVVREAAAITAYACQEFAEALREIRTMRRLSGREDLRAMEADCERALGRPEKALEIIRGVTFQGLPEEEQVELLLVQAGARVDLGQTEIAIKQLRELQPKEAHSRYRVQEMLASLTGEEFSSPIAEPVAVEEESSDPVFVDLEDDGREFFLR